MVLEFALIISGQERTYIYIRISVPMPFMRWPDLRRLNFNFDVGQGRTWDKWKMPCDVVSIFVYC